MEGIAKRRQPVKTWSVFLAIVCSTIWAGQAVAVKFSLVSLPPYLVMGMRFLFAVPILASAAILTGHSLRMRGRDLARVLGNAVLVYIQTGLFTVGTGLTTSVRSIVIINSFPLFTAIACHFLLRGFPLTWQAALGIVVAFLGIVVVFTDRLAEGWAAIGWGDGMVLLAAIVMGIKIAYVKSILRDMRPIQVVFWGAVLSAPLCLLTSLVLEEWQGTIFSWSSTLAVAYQGCVVTGLAVLIWTSLLAKHAPNQVTVYRLTTPPLGVLFGWMLLGEPLTPYLIVGAVLIICGIYHVTQRDPAAGSID